MFKMLVDLGGDTFIMVGDGGIDSISVDKIFNLNGNFRRVFKEGLNTSAIN